MQEQQRRGNQRGGRPREFDARKEKQLANRVFSQGQNKQDHR
jgi:VacB/RNase II family 3'-5' exoribonuclease